MGNNLLSLGTRSGKSQENQPWRKFGNKKLKDVDHDATDEVNLLMDRWSPSDVLILMRKFKQQARLQHSKKSDKMCFQEFPPSTGIGKVAWRGREIWGAGAGG